ncbi:MAG: radical SAM protein [Synergistaceae bacterium]|nr:radical SAM protein [Synergistaceae bacterium]
MRFRKEKDYFSCFNEKTGAYIRVGKNNIDPFMSSFPELLDVGIMGHCKHGKLGLCIQAGVQCYQDGLHSTAPNMKLEDFAEIARQCSGKTYQFALGGCGDPDQHEHFKDILQICRENKIVPNYTTSGLGITDEIVALTKEYCGAVAVSWYRSDYTLRALQLFIEAGIKTNIHFVLSKRSIDEALSANFPDGINAVVFLLHKPVGLGTHENVLKISDMNDFISTVTSKKFKYKIGFDSCTVPALVNNLGIIDEDSIDTCEGARWSAYITSDMKMLPCSFDNQNRRWEVDLREKSIQEAWNSEVFEDFRNRLRNACPNCEKRAMCMGGCPICPEIVLCKKL